MAKAKTPPPPSALHSYEPPTEVASHPPSQRHHHDHEHHHHHSHYVRSVSPGETVKGTIEEKQVDELKEEKIVEAQVKVAPELVAPPVIASAKASTNAKSRAASVEAPSAAATISHITRTKSILATTSAPAQVVEVVPAAPSASSIAAPPTTVVPSVKARPSKAPSVKPVNRRPSVKVPSIIPPSLTSSHRSRYSHHHPEVIVNVTIPQAVAAPAPLSPPVIAAVLPAPTVIEGTVKETTAEKSSPLVVPATVPPTTTQASTIVTSPAAPPSPSPSTRSRLFRLHSTKPTTAPLPPVAPTAGEQGVEGEPEEEIVEETKVVTTTRTSKRRPASPPKVSETGSRYVENILEEEAPAHPPPPPPPPSTKPKSVKSRPKSLASLSPLPSAPNTPVTMKCHFFGSKSSPPPPKTRTVETTTVETVSYPLLPQSVEEADVDTAATTAGGPTTKGIRGARSVALTASSGRMSGTKAGIRPIPMVDYQALMKRSPAPSQKKSLSPPTVPAAPAPVPSTTVEVTTAPAQAVAATELPPATTVAVTAAASSTGPPPNALPPSTAPPPSTLERTTVAMEATALTSPKTIMTLSAQLDKDSHGNEHLHARWRDHTNVNEVDLNTGHDAGEHVETTESPGETDKERTRREKREKKEREKRDKLANSAPYRPVGALPPPKSERYAYPPAPTEIGRQARERLSEKTGRGGPPLPLPRPQLFPRPPPLVGVRPPTIPHQMFNPMMLNPMMSGYPMGTMGMPMGMGMPMAAPIPGIMPGMPGVGNLPRGWFGRDQLGRDFAGPGGVGSSQPYRPPDPSALPPMPFGLPFIARPGQEGFDQYGRMLPPTLPEGWDGWGRPIVAAGANPPAPAVQPLQEPPAPLAQPRTRAVPRTTQPSAIGGSTYGYPNQSGSQTSTLVSETATNRPDQPPCFDRPPAQHDSYYRYEPFEAFSFSAKLLNHPHQLHLPPELVSRDVNEQDWMKFIEDFAREALHGASHSLTRQARGQHTGPDPILSEAVHSLLASWAVAFFAPRGIRVYAAQNGKKVIPPPIGPSHSTRGYSHASEWSDSETASDDDFGYGSEDEKERQARKGDMYLPKREREIRRSERIRMRKRERRRRMREFELKNGENREAWEIHFVPATPTIWLPGARPRTYGEPVVRLKR